jgi:hypothetical protein
MIHLLGNVPSPSRQPGSQDSGVKVFASLLHLKVPPFGVMAIKPLSPRRKYRDYKRVRQGGLKVMALRPIYLYADMWQSPGLKPPCRGTDVERT